MSEGVLKTQGTQLYTVDTLTSSVAAVIKFECPTGITGIGAGAKDQIETTCLDTLGDKTYTGGLGNTGTISVPFNFEPGEVSHQLLEQWKQSGDVMEWLVGFSDGIDVVPTLDSNDALVAPASPLRTSLVFNAYVSEYSLDASTNEIVRGTLTLQRSGSIAYYYNGPYSA